MKEQQHRFGMGCPSITGEYHAQCTEALLSSLNNSSLRHAKITKTLMQKQIAHLSSEAKKAPGLQQQNINLNAETDGLPLTGASASQHPYLKASHPAGTKGMSYKYT